MGGSEQAVLIPVKIRENYREAVNCGGPLVAEIQITSLNHTDRMARTIQLARTVGYKSRSWWAKHIKHIQKPVFLRKRASR